MTPGSQTATGRPISSVEGTLSGTNSWYDAGKKDEFGLCDQTVNPLVRWGTVTYDITGTIDWNANGTGKIYFDGVFADGPKEPGINCQQIHYEGSYRPVGVLSTTDITGAFFLNPPTTRIEDLTNGVCTGVVQDPQECQGNLVVNIGQCWHDLGGVDITGATQTLSGKLESSLPTITDPPLPDRQVHRASVTVYEQQLGAVRDPNQGETAAQYRAYLQSQPRRAVATVTIDRDAGRLSSPDNPGVFEIKNLPIARIASDGSPTNVLYTIEVTDAETDEVALDGMGQPDPSMRTLLPFRDTAVPNVDLVNPPPQFTIALEPFTATGVKRVIAEDLSNICPVSYAPVEEAVFAYLDDIENGTIPLDEGVEEALERGLWAERAVLGGAKLSSEMLEEVFEALGVLLANIYDDVTDFTRADVAKASKQFNKIKNAPANVNFGFDAQTKAAIAGISQPQLDLLVFSTTAQILKAVFKGLAPYMESALVKHGVAPADAEELSNALTVGMLSLLTAIETGTKGGALTPLVKTVIKQAVASLHTLFLDSPDPLLLNPVVSYCGQTKGLLDSASSQMIAWMSFDPTWATGDRNRVVDVITDLNDAATFALATARFQAEITTGLDNSENALRVVALLPGPGGVVATSVGAAKYLTNLVSIVGPALTVYVVVPDAVEEAINAAFGNQSASQVAGRSATDRALLAVREWTDGSTGAPRSMLVGNDAPMSSATLTRVDDSQDLLTALDTVRASISANQIGNAIEQTFGTDPGSYLSLLQSWHRSVELYFDDIFAIEGSDGILTPEGFAVPFYALNQWADLRAAELDLIDLMRDFYGAVLSGDYEDPTDPSYLNDRLGVIAAMSAVRGRLEKVAALVGGDSSPFGFATTRPAVAVELLDVLSDATGKRSIQSSPESFTLRARVRNLSDVPVSGLSLRLAVHSPKDSLAAAGATELPVGGGTLTADDGVPDQGTDEAIVTWQLDYTGDLSWEIIGLAVDLRENGAEPTTFFNDPALGLLSVAGELGDSDFDGVPDDLEAQVGLTVGVDDAGEDLDGDGLDNLTELLRGTNPSMVSSDADTLSDYEELTPGADGVVTDPLNADTDGDGTQDDADGAPTDPRSTDASSGGNGGEPVVSVDRTLVALSDGVESAAIEVNNAGSGELRWVARPAHSSLLSISPGPGTIASEGTVLTIGAPEGFDFAAVGMIETTVVVTDVSGAERDEAVITVRMGNAAGIDYCGRASDDRLGNPLTAVDALATLRAAVGSITCDLCRCDVDSSGSISASDALLILKSAVGQPVTLQCIACS